MCNTNTKKKKYLCIIKHNYYDSPSKWNYKCGSRKKKTLRLKVPILLWLSLSALH